MVKAIGLGIGYALFVLIFYITSWRAFIRIIRHREDWFKTRRNAEFISDIELSGEEIPAVLEMTTTTMGEW